MEKFIIEMESITPEYIPACSGKYLVKTISTGDMKSVDCFQARVSVHTDNKSGKKSYSIDVHNQITTHISTKPL